MGSINMRRILITVFYMTSVVATTALAEGSQCISALKNMKITINLLIKKLTGTPTLNTTLMNS